MKSTVVDISIQLWSPIVYGHFAPTKMQKIVRCSSHKTKINYYLIFNLFLVSINELMERGLVNFNYTKLCFTVGGGATDPKPNKVYQSVRVSCTLYSDLIFEIPRDVLVYWS